MTALAANRSTPRNAPGPFAAPIADNVKIYEGALTMLSAGNLTPGATATAKLAAGRSRKLYDNTVVGHAAGALTVEVDEGEFWWANGDSIVAGDVGKVAYILDDQTVTKGNSGQSPAGIIVGFDSSRGVCVRTSVELSQALALGVGAEPAATIQTGTGALVAGTLTISSVTITASSRIFVTRKDPAGTLGTDGLDVPVAGRTVGAGTGSFIVNAINDNAGTGTSDTSTFDWLIVG
jgi:hypothetical protein